jgi:hypothetical protein
MKRAMIIAEAIAAKAAIREAASVRTDISLI